MVVRQRWVPVAVAVALVLAGCGRVHLDETTRDDDAPESFALALGIDADDSEAASPLDGYDLVVVDGGETSAAAVARLQDGGATVLGYLSVGTVERGRSWFDRAKQEGWLLEHWDDWDEWYADVAEPGLRRLLADEARAELAKGFDGLFLDNTDMVEAHPDQRDGMRALVADLDGLVGDDGMLFAQNGDPEEAGIVDHLDGWNREDVSSTYDFDTEAYAVVSAADRRAAIGQLKALQDAGLIVTATDYVEQPDDGAADGAADRACAAGAIPFASDIGLTHIADPPRTCEDT